jgi:hypothetical protein|tara:strand:+ start:865 stop:1131 length:267 start_codon:yes stop_codon:yes gene_type:complete
MYKKTVSAIEFPDTVRFGEVWAGAFHSTAPNSFPKHGLGTVTIKMKNNRKFRFWILRTHVDRNFINPELLSWREYQHLMKKLKEFRSK